MADWIGWAVALLGAGVALHQAGWRRGRAALEREYAGRITGAEENVARLAAEVARLDAVTVQWTKDDWPVPTTWGGVRFSDGAYIATEPRDPTGWITTEGDR